ncbi:MAG: hypothetical protein CMG34_08005 [Candidatus Marinimicrobia bacterium]|nr:hypothetical protein [Candidatus Neomarinimicrobiota bacterium]|tara:strand:- start:260 stop:478 length:219 start_codon:yes stop_codon:yes gene_type:complete
MKNDTLIRSFIEGNDKAKNGSLSYENGKLKSYNLVIADRDKREIYKVSYSKTTSTHINKVIYWATGYTIIEQ